MKLNRDYILGAFIGGAAVSIIGGTRLASTSEELESKRKALKSALSSASTKEEIIALQSQQMELDKTEIDQLRSQVASLNSQITQLENTPVPNLLGVDVHGMYKIAYQWNRFAMYLSGKINDLGAGHPSSQDFYQNVSLKLDPNMKYDQFLTYPTLPQIPNPKNR